MSTTLPNGPDLLISREGACGLIILNRPRQKNALTTAMRARIAEVLPAWVRDPGLYAVIVASAAGEVFCAGGDLRELVRWGDSAMAEAKASRAAECAHNCRLDGVTEPTLTLRHGRV